MIVCYNILESVRLFFLKEKVNLLQISHNMEGKRHITDASRARVRYVAGYCLASLRKTYSRMLRTHLYDTTKDGQNLYSDARIIMFIISLLQEDEHYLKTNTSEPTSLIDVERRQYTSRGLTNVNDALFNFFIKLTEMCLLLLVRENLMQYGSHMFDKCLQQIQDDTSLYEQFAHVISISYAQHPLEQFGESGQVTDILQDTIIFSSLIEKVFKQISKKYLMVLLGQYRKDVKNTLKIEKKMSHRKQIKVSKGNSKTKQTSIDMGKEQQPQAGCSKDYSPPAVDESDLCRECLTDAPDEWIQCDKCNRWYHRKCTSLKSNRMWKKFSKDGVSWKCKRCV